MAEKTIKGRLVQKHDVEANWQLATNFIPKQGEIIVYDKDSNYSYERVKIGDGTTLVSALPFVTDAIEDIVDTALTNAKAYTDAEITEWVGDTTVATQISAAIADKADKTELPQIVSAASTDGVAFTATASNVSALAAGISFIMVPARASSTTSPTLNVNGLGAKYIRRRLSTGATVDEGYTTTWLTKNKPFRVMYDGTQWIVEGHNKPVVADIYGTLSVEKGGTGATTAADALTNLGAAAADHTHEAISTTTIDALFVSSIEDGESMSY